MLAIMHTPVRRGIFVSVLLLSVLATCVSEEREESCPKIYSKLSPVQLDAWSVVRDPANPRRTRNVNEAGDISDRDLEGGVRTDKRTADRREAEGVEGTEGGRIEVRKEWKNEAGVSVLSPELNLAHRMMSALPPFVPSTSQHVTNEQCIKDSQFYLQELRKFAVWALNMHDASAKLLSGLLNGNVNQYGDIDQCLQVRSPWQGPVIKGRYCLTTMALRLSDPHHPLLQHIHQLLQSHEIFRSELDDCITDTHHLGTDIQLFALSPLLVYMVWKWPRTGMSVLTGLAAISTALRYNVTVSRHLTYYFFRGNSIRRSFLSCDLSYTLPAHRATTYIMGIALGFVLRYCGRDFKLKKVHLTLGWTAAIICFYLSVISPAHMADPQYVYNPRDAANYTAFATIFLCFFVAWYIFLSYIGQAGLPNRVFSWRGFLVTTRLSYALYLTQFPVFFYFVGKNRTTHNFNLSLLVDVPEVLLLVVSSVLLTVLVELPFQNILNIMLKKPK